MNRLKQRPRVITELENELRHRELRRCLDKLTSRGTRIQDVARTLGVAPTWLYNVLYHGRTLRPVPPWLILAVKAIEARIPVTEPVEDRVMESLDQAIAAIEQEIVVITSK